MDSISFNFFFLSFSYSKKTDSISASKIFFYKFLLIVRNSIRCAAFPPRSLHPLVSIWYSKIQLFSCVRYFINIIHLFFIFARRPVSNSMMMKFRFFSTVFSSFFSSQAKSERDEGNIFSWKIFKYNQFDWWEIFTFIFYIFQILNKLFRYQINVTQINRLSNILF